MKVHELKELLSSFPDDMDIAYKLYSEHCILEVTAIKILRLGETRPDGWVHDSRPDKETIEYLVFPGN